MATRPVDPAEGRLDLRFFYRGWRPTRAGKLVNRAWAWLSGLGVTPPILLTLQVKGRRSGRLRTNVVVPATYAGERYLVSMLGERSEWVRNVRAAGGAAYIKRGGSRPVTLTEIPAAARAPILKAYCQVATSGRHHFPVPPTAPLSEFEAIAADYPVFRMDLSAEAKREESPPALRSAVVSFGPSLLVMGLAVACTVATLRRLVGGAPGHRQLLGIPTIGALAPWVYFVAGRPRVLRWGARPDEVTRALPGDELVPRPAWSSTRAVSIAAPPEAIWPWLAQMGQDRGGLYSYAWLENLAGLDFHNADRIHPEWQDVAPGDMVRFAPGQDTLTVARVEPNRALAWRILDPVTHQAPDPARAPSGITADATWAFVLEPDGPGETRLVQRFRFGGRPRWLLGPVYTLLIEVPHFIMERGMLHGIQARAERAWKAEAEPS